MSELAGSEQNDAEIALTEEQTLAKDAKTRALANEVWSTLEIRSAIVEHMDTTELPETIHLDKASLATVAKRLYREITYIEYDRFAWQGSSYFRRRLYTESIRELDIRGALPWLSDIDGFRQLLDMFPLLNVITASSCSLNASTRSLDEEISPAPATLYVKRAWDESDESLFSEAVTVDFPMLPQCVVEYDIEIFSYANLCWGLSTWDDIGLAGAIEGLQYPNDGPLSLARVLCRPIRSLRLDHGEFQGLSNHLDRRAEHGFRPITDIRFGTDTIEGLPAFLSRHPKVTRCECYRWGICQSISLGEALVMDWDGAGRDPEVALRYLSIEAQLVANEYHDSEPPSTDSDVCRAVERRSGHHSLTDLDTLTLSLVEVGRWDHLRSIPRLSTVAKALVQIGGTRFLLIIDIKLEEPDEEARSVYQYVRSQITQEVIRRQEKERKKPKYIRPRSKGGV